jgi:hypothetical protein
MKWCKVTVISNKAKTTMLTPRPRGKRSVYGDDLLGGVLGVILRSVGTGIVFLALGLWGKSTFMS